MINKKRSTTPHHWKMKALLEKLGVDNRVKRNGVDAQCKKQRKLVRAPIISCLDFSITMLCMTLFF